MDPDQYFGVKNLKTGTAEKTGLVDPYCVLEFAGHVGKTHVIWKDHDPVWNKQFNFSIMVSTLDSVHQKPTLYQSCKKSGFVELVCSIYP